MVRFLVMWSRFPPTTSISALFMHISCPSIQCSFSKLPGSTRWGGRVSTAPPCICSRQDGCQHVEGSVYQPVDSQSVPERNRPAVYRSTWCPLQSRYVQSVGFNAERVCGCKGLGCWKRRVEEQEVTHSLLPCHCSSVLIQTGLLPTYTQR